MYDDEGNQVYEPEEARRFFADKENLMVAVTDDADNSSIRLLLGASINIRDVLGLDQTLRTTATKFNMMFNVKTFNRDLVTRDFATKASVREGKEKATMDYLLEGMYGTTRSSYLKLENARMIVRHSKKIDENVMGSRGRHIDAIFIENAQQERFLFPTRQLAPARAMTQHINHGGGFADAVGAQIQRMAQDYSNLGQASNYVASNQEMLGESAMSIREACRSRMKNMKKCFERLQRISGYVTEAQRIEDQAKTLNETEDNEILPEDYNVLGETLTAEGVEPLGEGVIRSVYEAMKSCADDAEGLEEGRDPKVGYDDVACPTCKGKEDLVKSCRTCKTQGYMPFPNLILGHFVSDKAFKKLLGGQLDVTSKPPFMNGEHMPQFSSKIAELAFKVAETAPLVKNDSLSNLLTFTASQLDRSSNSPGTQKALVMLAQKSLGAIKDVGFEPKIDLHGKEKGVKTPKTDDDGLAEQAQAIREFDAWLDSYSPTRILSEWDEDEYDNDRFPGDSDPLSHRSGAREDAAERAAERVSDNFDPQAFLASHGSDFGWDDDSLEGDDLSYDKSYILSSLDHYLSKQVEAESGFKDMDMENTANDLWPAVAPLLTAKGYSLSEAELGPEDLMRGDMVIPTNQGLSLKREVTKATSTDPVTGEEVPADTSYVSRLRTLAGMPWNK